MIITALLGAGAGLGVWLVGRALLPRPVSLGRVLAGLDRPGRPACADMGRDTEGLASLGGRLAIRAVTALGVDVGHRAKNLALVGRSAERHAVDKLIGAVGGLAGTALVGAGLGAAGIGVPPGAVAVLALGTAVAGFHLPEVALRDEAERRRRGFRHALSAYLDLVNVILAGGGGTETALYAAGEAGDGWAFAALRGALDRARLTNRSPWDAFGDLATDLGVPELADLAASMALAGTQGARIRRSLAAKADTMRGHQLAETEAAAEAATERMTLPVAVLLFGFLVFIAYPAVQQITTVQSAPMP